MYIDSVMNYTGSKFKLLDQILPEFDYSKKTFIDLFCGGGSVYINILDKYGVSKKGDKKTKEIIVKNY